MEGCHASDMFVTPVNTEPRGASGKVYGFEGSGNPLFPKKLVECQNYCILFIGMWMVLGRVHPDLQVGQNVCVREQYRSPVGEGCSGHTFLKTSAVNFVYTFK